MALAKAFGVDGRHMTVGQRIEQCIAAAGGLNRAAEAVGMTPQGLRGLVRERSQRGAPLLPMLELARAAGVTLDWIATGHDRRPDLPDAPARGMTVLYRYELGLNGELIEIADHGTDVAFRNEYLTGLGIAHPSQVALLTVGDDAMAPTVPAGSLAVVDRAQRAIAGAGLYAIGTGAGIAVRRAQPMLDGSVKLLSDNPRYEPELVAAAAVKGLKVAGRVRAAIVTL